MYLNEFYFYKCGDRCNANLTVVFCSQDDRMSKAKVSDILSEIFKKIGSKENTKEVSKALPLKVYYLFVLDLKELFLLQFVLTFYNFTTANNRLIITKGLRNIK